ncbi:diacylglycerol kinase family protein [Mucilaginibacter sp. cycad4]|uniref:diacylglycerol/lipid kinase family protein n=1 Tax=Mucilaginibacter sp. cycad4 TaxID=3342096 RepID=UPI002AAA7EBE|nr:diacylglycerol kinase family protein [Mucilaginibacter gossypii]WPV00874.1 diacylglycerol kinase family protein [Mucilaginibacter gossypii]
MKFKQIHFIINPASGKEEPILSYINKVLDGSGIGWDISVTKRNTSAGSIAKALVGKSQLVAVYGGDGCVTEVAAALHGTTTPMAIIPGGTANVMAKELNIPQETTLALELLKNNTGKLNAVDMGMMNGKPFLLRVNCGIMADMVLQADRELKDNIGQLAYGITAIKTINEAEPVKYQLEIDDQVIEEEAVSLTVTNSGNIGIGDFTLQPGISITDGLLDVILLKDNSFTSILKIAGSALLQNKTDAVRHWQCRRVVIRTKADQKFICDDFEQQAKKIEIEVIPASINILVPRNES